MVSVYGGDGVAIYAEFLIEIPKGDGVHVKTAGATVRGVFINM